MLQKNLESKLESEKAINGFCKDWQSHAHVNKRKLSFIGHVARSHGIGNDILLGMVCGTRRRGRPRKKLENDIKDVVGMSMAGLLRSAQSSDNLRNTIVAATVGQP